MAHDSEQSVSDDELTPNDKGDPRLVWDFSDERGQRRRQSQVPISPSDPRRSLQESERAQRQRGSQRSHSSSPFSRPSNTRTDSPRIVEGETTRLDVATVRKKLDAALDRWWQEGALPSQGHLREGLETLLAGGALPEAQRTLLLRTALAHGRGIETALRFQSDHDRVGIVMAEMLADGLDPLRVRPFLVRDTSNPARTTDVPWRLPLRHQLRLMLVTGTVSQRRHARRAYEMLFEIREVRAISAGIGRVGPVKMRRVMLVGLIVALTAFAVWQRLQWMPPADMIYLAPGSYSILTEGGDGFMTVSIGRLYVDRFEVTNAAYRRCVERGACDRPASNESATHENYWETPAFSDYPVVNVSYMDAMDYCTWRGKRLPDAREWQVAAVGLPDTPGTPFPWGMEFARQRANGLDAGFGDALVVGAFRPAGDNEVGVSDLSGNVAEWTTSLVQGEPSLRIVKGGSYLSPADEMTIYGQESIAEDETLPWVGFRCVSGPLTRD